MTESLHRSFLETLLSGDRHAAFLEIERVRARGVDLTGIYLEVFEPALCAIGELWQLGEITVADEHVATAITEAAMANLYRDLFAEAAPAGPTLLAACANGEHHQIGLRMVCDMLELDGWETTFVGASAPTGDLVDLVRRRAPDVVALSASMPERLDGIRAVLSAIRNQGGRRPLLVIGGRAVRAAGPDAATALGADLALTNATDASGRLRAALA